MVRESINTIPVLGCAKYEFVYLCPKWGVMVPGVAAGNRNSRLFLMIKEHHVINQMYT